MLSEGEVTKYIRLNNLLLVLPIPFMKFVSEPGNGIGSTSRSPLSALHKLCSEKLHNEAITANADDITTKLRMLTTAFYSNFPHNLEFFFTKSAHNLDLFKEMFGICHWKLVTDAEI